MLTLGPRDAILIPAGTVRSVRNDSDAPAAFAMVSVTMDDPVAGSAFHEGFWPLDAEYVEHFTRATWRLVSVAA